MNLKILLPYFITSLFLCQALFSSFFKRIGKNKMNNYNWLKNNVIRKMSSLDIFFLRMEMASCFLL